jgi:hypothetical protein
MVRRIRNVATAVIGVVAAAIALSTAVGTLMGQASAQSASTPPAPGNGSVMVQTHKRAQPQVAQLETAEDPNFNEAQGPGPGPIGAGPGCNVFPAPANIGTKVNLSYFGPPPSTVNPSLVGPEQLLKSGTVDAAGGTITLPLYLGIWPETTKRFGTF